MSPTLALVGFVGLCLLVGASGAALASAALHGWYLGLTRPPGTPQVWVVAPISIGFDALIGGAAWLVWRRVGPGKALRLWGWQLGVSALWSPAFFAFHKPAVSLGIALALLVLVIATMISFRPVSRAAAWLMLPYLLWTGYAVYLNAGFCCLNPG